MDDEEMLVTRKKCARLPTEGRAATRGAMKRTDAKRPASADRPVNQHRYDDMDDEEQLDEKKVAIGMRSEFGTYIEHHLVEPLPSQLGRCLNVRRISPTLLQKFAVDVLKNKKWECADSQMPSWRRTLAENGDW